MEHKIFKAYSTNALLVMYAGTLMDEGRVISHVLDRYANVVLIACNRRVIWANEDGSWLARKLRFEMPESINKSIKL